VIVLIVLVTILVTGGVVLYFLPRGKVAEILVQPGVPFELRCSPNDDREYKVCLRYSLAWQEGGKNAYGLACVLTGSIDGSQVVDEAVKVGGGKVDVPTRSWAGTEYLASTSSGPSGYSKSATVVLAKLGRRALTSEITVSGTITPGDNVGVRSLKVYVAR
jgi:hypothetical protein